ncbi:MAG: ABC-2 type transporter [Candidatus Parvarchaeum acidiphilum ARMAN-4]|jgi:ABC-2 type transport system permease protein|uniref:ABC-2 type transporter n=1 Tax=Candidatus Parvarchaeum acidiphilum ARMAN-4 TaxID=662760 RepID=D2EGI5_PARA4|nr:MAG: ABC-2 type transporter [Candidatus Parvarchaeum acidiphilum ARMAN-4]
MANKIKEMFKVFKMALWMNVTLLRRYNSNFIFWVIYAAANAILMLLFIPLYSASISSIGTKSIISFILIGAAMLPLLQETVSSVSGEASFQMWSGIINYSFTTPVSRYIYFSLNSMSEVIISLVIYSPIYLIAIIFAFNYLTPLGLLLSVICFIIGFLGMLQLGFMLGAAMLLFRRVEALDSIINLVITFLSGAFIPLQVLPSSVNYAALFVPLTSSLYLVRYYLVGSSLIAPPYLMWAITIGELIVFALIARFIFKAAEKKAEKIGFNYI